MFLWNAKIQMKGNWMSIILFFLYKVLDKNNIHLISFLFPIAVFPLLVKKMMGEKPAI